jgi:hypothetical protein
LLGTGCPTHGDSGGGSTAVDLTGPGTGDGPVPATGGRADSTGGTGDTDAASDDTFGPGSTSTGSGAGTDSGGTLDAQEACTPSPALDCAPAVECTFDTQQTCVRLTVDPSTTPPSFTQLEVEITLRAESGDVDPWSVLNSLDLLAPITVDGQPGAPVAIPPLVGAEGFIEFYWGDFGEWVASGAPRLVDGQAQAFDAGAFGPVNLPDGAVEIEAAVAGDGTLTMTYRAQGSVLEAVVPAPGGETLHLRPGVFAPGDAGVGADESASFRIAKGVLKAE